MQEKFFKEKKLQIKLILQVNLAAWQPLPFRVNSETISFSCYVGGRVLGC